MNPQFEKLTVRSGDLMPPEPGIYIRVTPTDTADKRNVYVYAHWSGTAWAMSGFTIAEARANAQHPAWSQTWRWAFIPGSVEDEHHRATPVRKRKLHPRLPTWIESANAPESRDQHSKPSPAVRRSAA